jgi:FtsZ-interacting cell division protein ZipA
MAIVIVAIIVIALVVAALLLTRQRRSQQLQQGFGPEYDRTVEERGGDRRAAEAELQERRERREKFEVRDLEPGDRDRYAERWRTAQRRFVDEPGPAVGEADALVMEVMRDRGYPVADEFEQRAADVSVDHPQVVEHYRAAHGISTRATAGEASTEDLRQAMVHFRALFVDLLGDDERPAADDRPAADQRAADDGRAPQSENVREMS